MTLYRSTVWFSKGLREYTKGGYEAAAKDFVVSDLDVDLSGKEFLITGSNSGIGKEAALAIAKRGGAVHMVCRNLEAAEAAKDEITTASGNNKVFVHRLDMSDPGAVHKFASGFVGSDGQKRLDVLINNAGCMVNAREVTAEGLEKNFATNTLGTHILTEGLIPCLRGGAVGAGGGCRPRVVTVSSGGMLVDKLDTADLQTEKKTFDGTLVYSQNKRQQVVMTGQYAKKYPDLQFSVMHPGWADTPAVRSSMPSFYNMMKNRLRTAEQGADTMVWLAISNNPDAVKPENSGEFYQDRRVVPKHLPLAWTRSTPEEEATFMKLLDDLFRKFAPSSF